MKSERKSCQNCKTEFRIEPDDFEFYEKVKVPPPTFCPECRLIRRLAWRNERSFHKRNCDNCKKSMISAFSPDSGMTVYCSTCWWSDNWDAADYGVDFDPHKPFLAQLADLLRKVPVMNLFGLYTTLTNSDYTNMVAYLKDCYMVTYSDYGENLIYGSFVNHCKDCVDNLMLIECELCYESVNCTKCYQTLFSLDCENCNNVYFSRNCSGCTECFGCTNLKNKQYYIFNKLYSKKEYEKELHELYPSSTERIRTATDKARELWNAVPQKYIHGIRNENVTGDYLSNSKNAQHCFFGSGIEDSKYCAWITDKITDSYDFTNFALMSSRLYESLQAGNQVYNVLFTWWAITNSQNIEYSMFLVGANNVFGSVGLKKKEYYILNKQYSKDEYLKLREKIIQQMNDMPYKDKRGNVYKYGEFFPIELSPFTYTETTAQEFYQLSENEIRSQGYVWRERLGSVHQGTIAATNLPSSAKEISESILKETVNCEHAGNCNEQCTIAFKLVPAELQFYRKMNLPLPRLCPNCRHGRRIQFRNPMKLWKRTCDCAGTKAGEYNNIASHSHGTDHCPNTFETAYAPERPEIVYCEECYQAEVA